jgi:thymidylate kinase
MKIRNYDFSWFFKYFRDEGIKIIVLRNYETLPYYTRNDIDIEVESHSYQNFLDRFLCFLDTQGLQLFKYIERPHVTTFKIYKSTDQYLEYIFLDVHRRGASWYGLQYLSNKEIFDNKKEQGNWYIPCLLYELIMKIFVNMLIASRTPDKYLAEISEKLPIVKKEFFEFIKERFPIASSQDFYDCLVKRDSSRLSTFIPILKRSLICRCLKQSPLESIGRMLKTIWAEIFFYVQKNGLFIVLIGPDGVGKTTISRRLLDRMDPVFKGVRYFHWIHVPFSKLDDNVYDLGGTKNHHHIRARFVDRYILSPMRLMKNWLKVHGAFWMHLFPELVRDRFIIGDKYVYPYLYDPNSVKYYGPKILVSLFLNAIPSPDIIFCLQASPNNILKRKKELNRDQIEQIMERIRGLRKGKGNGLIISIDANRSIDQIEAEITYHIFSFLSERNYQRSRNPLYNRLLMYPTLSRIVGGHK